MLFPTKNKLIYLNNNEGVLMIQRQSGVYVPMAYAESSPSKPPVMEEVATTSDGRDITLGYVDGLPYLPTTDPLQIARGGDLKIYEQARSDDQVQTALQQRKLALSGKEWTVTAGGTAAKDKAAADFVREQLKNLPFDRLSEKMLSGLFWGYAVAECLWVTDGRFIVASDIKVKKQRRFRFAPDGSLRLLTSANQLGEVLPERKFWAYSTGGDDDDDYYGLGLAHWLYWPVFFKRSDIRFWLVFLEKFGMPTAVGKYPNGASSDEKKRLLQALGAIQSDSGVRIPETMSIELLEAARSGTADYLEMYNAMNATISKVILGHTGTTDSIAGKLGGDNMASEVRADLVAADADLICSSFNRTVVKWLVEWNFNGAKLPTVYRDVAPATDLKMQVERDKVIFDMGYKPTLDYISTTYDIAVEAVAAPAPIDKVGVAQPTTNTQVADKSAPAFSEPNDADPTPVTDYTEQLSKLAATPIDSWIAQIKTKVDSAESLESLQNELVSMYGNLPTEDLTKVMALAYATADLAGRFDVLTEIK
jgi:phage gp29-like protein